MVGFEPNCQAIAPFDLPYLSLRDAWAAQERWTAPIFVWPRLAIDSAWFLAGSGMPGLRPGQPRLDRKDYERAAEEVQLAFLRRDIQHSRIASVRDHVAFLAERGLPRPEALIAGMLGPLSLGLTLVDDREQPLWHDLALRDVMTQHLRLRAAWLEDQLRALCADVGIVLLEPFWRWSEAALFGETEAELLACAEEIAQEAWSGGLAPSGAVDWPRVLRSSIDIVVCQPEQRAALLACGGCVNDFIDRGGTIVWALVPSASEALREATPEALLQRWDDLLRDALDQDVLTSRLLSGSLISVAAGLGGQSIKTADSALAMLSDTARMIRARYKLI